MEDEDGSMRRIEEESSGTERERCGVLKEQELNSAIDILEQACLNYGYILEHVEFLAVFNICIDRFNNKVYIKEGTSSDDISKFIQTYL